MKDNGEAAIARERAAHQAADDARANGIPDHGAGCQGCSDQDDHHTAAARFRAKMRDKRAAHEEAERLREDLADTKQCLAAVERMLFAAKLRDMRATKSIPSYTGPRATRP